MSELNDTNVINRGGIDALIWIQRVAAEILEHGGSRSDVGYHMIEELNRECIQKNISPGGGADILSAVVLLRRFEEILEHLNTRKVKNNELPY